MPGPLAITGQAPSQFLRAIPVSEDMRPLSFDARFKKNLNAMAWLWKDHTAFAEAEEITTKASQIRPEYLTKIN